MSFNTLDTARFVTLSPNLQTFTGAVNLNDQIDYYRIPVNGKSYLQLSLTGLSGDANIRIFQDINHNNEIEFSESLYSAVNTHSISEFISVVLNPGTYFISVEGAETTNYQLNLSGVSTPTAHLIWRNAQTGENALWTMESAAIASSAFFSPVPDRNWQIVGHADFNYDNRADLVWRNIQTGENAIWYMNGSTFLSSALLTPVSDLNWQMVGIGDLNSDRHPDLVWRNLVTGENAIWYMNNASIASSSFLLPVKDRNWQIVGAGNFNQNGNVALFWRNVQTGENALWYMNKSDIASSAMLIPLADRNWQIESVADFNRDGNPDLIWRNVQTGDNALWLLNGATLLSGTFLTPVADSNWQIVGASPQLDEPVPLDAIGDTQLNALNLGNLDFRNAASAFASFTEHISYGDQDVYQFTLHGIAEIWISQTRGSVRLQLLDMNGNPLKLPEITETSMRGFLSAGTYFIQVSAPTYPGFYHFNFSAVSRSVREYSFIYYYNGQDAAADYYSGTVSALDGSYYIGQFYDFRQSNNETSLNGRYFITSSRKVGTVFDLNQVIVQSYYDSETTSLLIPTSYRPATDGLGSEAGWLRDLVDSQFFGADLFEADLI